MGPLPGDEKRCPLAEDLVEEVDCGTYIRRMITYAAESGDRAQAYLLIPKQALDGHGRVQPFCVRIQRMRHWDTKPSWDWATAPIGLMPANWPNAALSP